MADRYFLGGHDLEMAEIARLLAVHAPGRFHDKGLRWGAKLSAYRNELAAAIAASDKPVLIELADDLPRDAFDRERAVVVVDHHGDLAGRDRPTSIEQVFDRLGLPRDAWTRRLALVAANDRGHVAAMKAIGATAEEMRAIRSADRAAQGVTEEEEREATRAIGRRVENHGLAWIETSSDTASAIADGMDADLGGPGHAGLVVAMPGEVAMFADGALIARLADMVPGSYWGGDLPRAGFWGCGPLDEAGRRRTLDTIARAARLTTFVLRLEGIDFATTVEDVQQLSAYRGGSLALLEAPRDVARHLRHQGVANRLLFRGASIGAFRIHVDEAEADRIRKDVVAFLQCGGRGRKRAPHAQMSYVVDIAKGGDLPALRRAEARNRARQLQRSWPLPAFDARIAGVTRPGGDEADAGRNYDFIRPADTQFRPPRDKLLLPDRIPAHHFRRINVSASFRARHDYGRYQRQAFYAFYGGKVGRTLAREGLHFTNHFEDIVADPPEVVPRSLRNKLAIFYADGNKFGARYRAETTLDGYSRLSARMRDLQQRLLESLLEWLKAGALGSHWRSFAVREPEGEPGKRNLLGLRFETLLWGGDELAFVMPAWLGLPFLRRFLGATDAWTAADGAPLSHAVGLVFCHYKTPIRQARRLARTLADDAKVVYEKKPGNIVQIEVFESIAPPEAEGGLARYRERLFPGAGIDRLRDMLTLAGGEWGAAYRALLKLRAGDFPRSQIYRHLRMDDAAAALAFKTAADDRLKDSFSRYLRRTGASGMTAKDLILPHGLFAHSLTFHATLWDYAMPELAGSDPGEPA